MEWLKQLLESAKITDGILEVDSLVAAINKEFPKHAVPKETFNATNEQLKTATKTITDLQKNNSDNEELQKTITAHKETIKNMEKTHLEELRGIKIDTAINGLLTSNKAKYNDLLMSKFDKSKLVPNEDGTITGLEEQFNSIKTSYADLFEKVEEENPKPKEGEGNKNPYEYSPKGGSEGGDDLATIAMNAVLGL